MVFTVFVGLILFPEPSVDYWTRYIFETTRIAQEASWLPNESLRGMIARTLHSEEAAIVPWIAASALVMTLALLIARYAIVSKQSNIGLSAIALAGLLISPVSWHHLWVWIIPIAISPLP